MSCCVHCRVRRRGRLHECASLYTCHDTCVVLLELSMSWLCAVLFHVLTYLRSASVDPSLCQKFKNHTTMICRLDKHITPQRLPSPCWPRSPIPAWQASAASAALLPHLEPSASYDLRTTAVYPSLNLSAVPGHSEDPSEVPDGIVLDSIMLPYAATSRKLLHGCHGRKSRCAVAMPIRTTVAMPLRSTSSTASGQ